MGARPGGAGEAPDILDQCLLGPQITISQDEAPSLKEKGWVEGWPTRFVAGRRDLYSELPCESEARLAAMAARIAPPDRWTINPHFVRGTFYQEQRIDPCLCATESPHTSDRVGTQMVWRSDQNQFHARQDMRTCCRGAVGWCDGPRPAADALLSADIVPTL